MSENGRMYEFGEFRFVPSESQLLRGGRLCPLPPKAIGVLDLLVSNAGHVLEKDDLIGRVWEGSFVEESSVARTIWHLRQALNDTEKPHKFIQTVPTRGYRFIAPVAVVEDDNGLARDKEQVTSVPSVSKWKGPLYVVAVLLLIPLAATPIYFTLVPRPAPGENAYAERRTASQEAYWLFLQGMYAYEKRTTAEARKAVDLFDQAIRLDATYAPAWAGKGRSLRYAAAIDGADINAVYRESMAAIERALAIDPLLAEAHSAACENKLSYEYDMKAAEGYCLRALELNPNSRVVQEVYARFLTSRGRHSEAIQASKRAIDLEPSSLFYQRNFAVGLFYARRYDEAVIQLKRVIEMEDGFESVYHWLFAALQMQGKYDEAFEWFLRSRFAEGPDEQAGHRAEYQRSGWRGFIERYARSRSASSRDHFSGACFSALVGDTDAAFGHLERSFERREAGIAYLDVEPRLDAIRDDPRFESLVARTGIRR